MIQNKFIIVSPTYNTAPYIRKCVESVLNQTYRNFQYIVIDDCCTDGTTEILCQLFDERGGFILHHNAVRTESPLGNFKLGIDMASDDREDIIVTVDGDDWLYSDDVLEYLNGVYQDPDVWLTYGQFVSASGKIKNICKELKDTRNYRKEVTWITSHLRTIKRKLWDKIDSKDLRDSKGKYYVYYPDAAYMFPAIEIAGLKHIKFIDKVLYVYNDENPLCSADDWKTKKMTDVYKVSTEIRRKPVYDEIGEL